MIVVRDRLILLLPSVSDDRVGRAISNTENIFLITPLVLSVIKRREEKKMNSSFFFLY